MLLMATLMMTMAKIRLTRTQYDALSRVLSLRRLAQMNGMKTTRAQNFVLQSLADEDLAIVSEALNSNPNIDHYEVAEENANRNKEKETK